MWGQPEALSRLDSPDRYASPRSREGTTGSAAASDSDSLRWQEAFLSPRKALRRAHKCRGVSEAVWRVRGRGKATETPDPAHCRDRPTNTWSTCGRRSALATSTEATLCWTKSRRRYFGVGAESTVFSACGTTRCCLPCFLSRGRTLTVANACAATNDRHGDGARCGHGRSCHHRASRLADPACPMRLSHAGRARCGAARFRQAASS